MRRGFVIHIVFIEQAFGISFRRSTTQSVVQKSDINAPGKSPNIPSKKKLKFEYARFYAPLKVNEKNDSGTKQGLRGAYALFSLVFLNQNWEMKKIS